MELAIDLMVLKIDMNYRLLSPIFISLYPLIIACGGGLVLGGTTPSVAWGIANPTQWGEPARSPAPLRVAANPRLANQMLQLINLQRRKAQLASVQVSDSLTRAAQRHAQDLARNQFFSHTGSNGSQPGARAKAAGYSSGFVGENIAMGTSSPEAVMRLWMNSAGHRDNILNARYVDVGVGFANNYWVLMLGNP
jgi:uncharacterized protein YkwD